MLLLQPVDKSTQRIRLPDGRHLAYAEYGDPKGSPIFLFHGTPGSRYFRHPDESIITSLGIRLISPERPGFGLSDFQPDRTLLDWPDDLVVLADVLGLNRFGIIGYSGGGPHAAACALRIPARLSGAAMVSSPSPFNTPDLTAGMIWLNRVLFGLARESYALSRLSWWFLHAAFLRNRDAFMDFVADLSPRSEKAIIREPDIRAILIDDFAEAHRAGVGAVSWETVLLTRDWGFRPEDITMVVDLWQGDADVRTPVSMGRALAAAIPNSRARFLPGEGHDVVYRHWEDILKSLVFRPPEAEASPGADGEKRRPTYSGVRADSAAVKPSRSRRSARSVRISANEEAQAQDDPELVSAMPKNGTSDHSGT